MSFSSASSPVSARPPFLLAALILLLAHPPVAPAEEHLTLQRRDHWLVIRAPHIPGGEILINYLEAYCRPNSTDADWVKHTVIRHRSELLSQSPDNRQIKLRDTLEDGVIVDHTITAGPDHVTFQLSAHNPTSKPSEVHWAQPCVRLGQFTGYTAPHPHPDGAPEDYLHKCFVFLNGKPSTLPTQPWATKARYTPGQVYVPRHVPRTDVNPRPLSTLVPSNGLIGCTSHDDSLIFATAWEPYQELFQGVARCLHSDPRIGGLAPGETKQIRGKIYIIKNDPKALLTRYAEDFPEHQQQQD